MHAHKMSLTASSLVNFDDDNADDDDGDDHSDMSDTLDKSDTDSTRQQLTDENSSRSKRKSGTISSTSSSSDVASLSEVYAQQTPTHMHTKCKRHTRTKIIYVFHLCCDHVLICPNTHAQLTRTHSHARYKHFGTRMRTRTCTGTTTCDKSKCIC